MVSSRITVTVVCVLAVATLSAEQFRGDQRFKRFPSSELLIDYPDNWDIMQIPPTIAAFVDNAELSFTVERELLQFMQVYDEIFAGHERDLVSILYPDASGIAMSTQVHKTLGQYVQVDFQRAGAADRNPRPLQFRFVSIPVGRFVYRFHAVARVDDFKSRYDKVFRHMIDSVNITPPKVAPPKN